MNIKLELTQKLDQRLTMNQQLRQAIMLLQYNTIDLKELVQSLIEENPLLEVEENLTHSEAKSQYENTYIYPQEVTIDYNNRSDTFLENITRAPNLRTHLLDQTMYYNFTERDMQIAEAIIDAIDENGYFTLQLKEITDLFPDAEISEENVEAILQKIQTFDPPGICARNLRECLLLQLQNYRSKNSHWEIACRIVDKYFDLEKLSDNRRIMKILQISSEDYVKALSLIKSLNPRPGLLYSSEITGEVEPELYVKKMNNKWQVFIVESILTNIRVNQHYQKLIRDSKRSGTVKSLNKELQEAQWLIKGIKRRNETLYEVAAYIMRMQEDFLEQGPAYVKSMNLSEVAQALELHESTISRITTGKYVATAWGVFELKHFFPSHVTTVNGDVCSAAMVKNLIKEMVASELGENILSDNDIMQLLKERGINIARRTVAKYRKELNILPSYQRIKVS